MLTPDLKYDQKDEQFIRLFKIGCRKLLLESQKNAYLPVARESQLMRPFNKVRTNPTISPSMRRQSEKQTDITKRESIRY